MGTRKNYIVTGRRLGTPALSGQYMPAPWLDYAFKLCVLQPDVPRELFSLFCCVFCAQPHDGEGSSLQVRV